MVKLNSLSKRIAYNILTSTTEAGTGHPTSSLSALEMMTVLWFDGYLHYDTSNPLALNNDRIIFSKGHASPLLYALYEACGYISHEEILTLRKMDSRLEGHPTPEFLPIEVSTGSLGQGLSIGVGMALGFKNLYKDIKGRIPHVFVLLGDSEIAEGQIWEALQIAHHNKLNNLIAFLDMNRLGQRGETMEGWNAEVYKKRFEAFGCEVIIIENGNSLEDVQKSFVAIDQDRNKPLVFIAKTKKGAGISFIEDKDNWHGKPLSKEQCTEAIKELGDFDKNLIGTIKKPEIYLNESDKSKETPFKPYDKKDDISTREAYGEALKSLGLTNDKIVVLDAETSNSTFANTFLADFPNRFFEMYIAEQNMLSVALGLSKLGFIPYVSTFAAFLTRAYDQIRMSQYSNGNIKIVGSHCGVSIGPDGSSQMGLEDISMMRSVNSSIVLYPSDGVSTYALAHIVSKNEGIAYIRTTREKLPLIYDSSKEFKIGGSHVLHESNNDKIVVITAGITLHETLKAYEMLKKENISICIIDAYSVKPLDEKTIISQAERVKNIIVVEDHYEYGGLGEAVFNCLKGKELRIKHLAVRKTPHSGTPQELLSYEGIDAKSIFDAVVKG